MAKTISDANIPIQIVENGIKFKVRWRFLASVIGVLLGGGSIAGLTAIVGTGTSVASDLKEFKFEQDARHIHIDSVLSEQDKHARMQDTKLADVNQAIISVQTTQQRDVARNEARRVTEYIKDRQTREREYDRVYELNLRRLQRGEDPCGNVNCD